MRYAIVDGMNIRDSRVHNHQLRWNGVPSRDLLVTRSAAPGPHSLLVSGL